VGDVVVAALDSCRPAMTGSWAVHGVRQPVIATNDEGTVRARLPRGECPDPPVREEPHAEQVVLGYLVTPTRGSTAERVGASAETPPPAVQRGVEPGQRVQREHGGEGALVSPLQRAPRGDEAESFTLVFGQGGCQF